jgi:hypothetical protein
MLGSLAASLGLGQNGDIQENAQFALSHLTTDHGYPGITEFVSRHFLFHQRVPMDGQPTADSGEAYTVRLNIDSGQ